MTSYVIKAKSRDVLGKKVEKIRTEGLIPAVLYGHGIKNQNLSVNAGEFKKLFAETGESKLIDLSIDDKKPVKILIYDVKFNPLKDDIDHIDFYQIKEGEKISTEIELDFIGEAPAVKEMGGVLVKAFDALEIECLPSDLEKMDKINVDLSVLKKLDDVVKIKDLKVPAGVKIKSDPETVVALVEQIAEEKVEEVKTIESVEGIVKEEKTEETEGSKKEDNKK